MSELAEDLPQIDNDVHIVSRPICVLAEYGLAIHAGIKTQSAFSIIHLIAW